MDLNEELLYYWLALCPFTALKKNKLLQELSIFEIYDRMGADKDVEDFIGAELAAKSKLLKNASFLERSLEEMYKHGVRFVSKVNKYYPQKLRQSEAVPPIVLFYKGDVSLLGTPSVAVVGTRHPSDYGRQAAESIAEALSGYCVTLVSGMATGIDAYAHAAALKADVKTVAVLGSGLNKPTPLSNINLFRSICESGLVVSEYPINAEAGKHTFPERNRIISALSEVTIVVEAAEKSGALITADRALEQGRELLAVPGSIFSAKSKGTNALLKNGASPFTSVQDILSILKVQYTKISQKNSSLTLDFFEQTIYNLLQNGEKDINELCDQSGFAIKDLILILFSLEFKDAVIALPNKTYKVRGLKI